MVAKSILKWAGGKSAIVNSILRELPKGKRFIEPFAGSAIVFFNSDYPDNIVNDINKDIYNLYNIVKQEGTSFIESCYELFHENNNQKEIYYQLRAKFNELDYGWERARVFLYLNRHGYNGLCRYNQKGGYNVPFGRYKTVNLPKEAMEQFHERAKFATFTCLDFRDVMEMAGKDDVVYCDPPYAQLEHKKVFTAYHGHQFTETDQEDLIDLTHQAVRRGASVIISNHDTPYSRQLYQNARIVQFPVRRLISTNSDTRGFVGELLACFTPSKLNL